jgi:hypothetical protein
MCKKWRQAISQFDAMSFLAAGQEPDLIVETYTHSQLTNWTWIKTELIDCASETDFPVQDPSAQLVTLSQDHR